MQPRSVVFMTALLVGRGNQVSVAVWAACDRLVRVGTPAAGSVQSGCGCRRRWTGSARLSRGLLMMLGAGQRDLVRGGSPARRGRRSGSAAGG